VIGMALMPALAHAAPDVPPDKYLSWPIATATTIFSIRSICVFDGVLPLLPALRERGHWLAVATGKSRGG
jgi:phosphoglycolate phosphatase